MNNKLYYWADNLEDYSADNEEDYDQVVEIKRLNFFIGKNNAGKSRFLRNLFLSENRSKQYTPYISQDDISKALLPLFKIVQEKDQYHISFYESDTPINTLDKYLTYL